MTAFYTPIEDSWAAENASARGVQELFKVTISSRSVYKWIAQEFGELRSGTGATIWQIEYTPPSTISTDEPIDLIVIRMNGMLWWPNYMTVWYDTPDGRNMVCINGVDQSADRRQNNR